MALDPSESLSELSITNDLVTVHLTNLEDDLRSPQSQTNGARPRTPKRRPSLDYFTGILDRKEGNAIKGVRYRVLYKDESGSVLETSPFQRTKPNLKPDPEDGQKSDDDETTEDSVFDIINHVTIRDVVATESIKTTDAAVQAAGNAEDGDEANDEDKLFNKTFKIQSVDTSQMIIRSRQLIEAIRTVVKYYPGQELAGDTITIDEPCYMLLQYQSEIAAAIENQVSEPLKSPTIPSVASDGGSHTKVNEKGVHDLKVLQAYLEFPWKKRIEREVARYQKPTPRATFDMLWKLFRPGTRVFAKDKYHLDSPDLAGYIVRKLSLTDPNTPDARLVIDLWYLDNDGRSIDRSTHLCEIAAYEGERVIEELPIYPTKIVDGTFQVCLSPVLESQLIERGRKIWKIIQDVYGHGLVEVSYAGQTLDEKHDEYHGRAVLDPKSYFKHEPEHDPTWIGSDNDCESSTNCYWTDDPIGSKKRGPFASYQNIQPHQHKTTLDEGHFFVFGRALGGFTLKNRRWALLDIDHVSTKPRPDIRGNLQIPPDRLGMIEALTSKRHGIEKSWGADFIQNKGEGQIFLLHGPSGVGKTYTAECIAQLTERPLLSLTCADIGIDETQMEQELGKWFQLAEQWQAILLIDEADVYFEKRASGQLQRNSLVSAFLRSMEYYNGILFLTTNRLGHIDDAILSRIHLIIEYQHLEDKDRETIWKQFFEKLLSERPKFKMDSYIEEYIENDKEIKDLKWNGREIRNAFQTAVALAEHDFRVAKHPPEYIRLRKQHLQQVVKMSAAFKDYMSRFKGDESKRAYLEGNRMDETVKDGIRPQAQLKKERLDAARKAAAN